MECNIRITRVTWDCDKLIIFIFMHDVLRNQQVKCQFISLTFLKNMVHGEVMSYYTNVNILNCYKTSFIHIKTTTTTRANENIYIYITYKISFILVNRIISGLHDLFQSSSWKIKIFSLNIISTNNNFYEINPDYNGS